ncbi:MAG: hypothetical protein ABSD72_07100 [Terracidiphilus sp.]
MQEYGDRNGRSPLQELFQGALSEALKRAADAQQFSKSVISCFSLFLLGSSIARNLQIRIAA